MKDRIIVGVDLGSSKICGVVGERNEAQDIKLIGKISVNARGIEAGIIKDQVLAAEALNKLFKELQALTGRELTEAYITVPSGICTLVPVRGNIDINSPDRIIGKRELARVKDAAGLLVIPSDIRALDIIIDKYNIDDKMTTKSPYRMKGDKLELIGKMVQIKSNIYNSYKDCFASIHKSLMGIRISCEAASEILIDDLDKNRGVVLVDVGKDKTDIAIYNEGSLKTVEKIPLGGNNITKDLSYCFKVPPEEAENLKLSLANNAYLEENKNIDLNMARDIIEARTDEIVEFIDNLLKKYHNGNDISNIVIYGRGIPFNRKNKEKFIKLFDKNINFVGGDDLNLINSQYINSWGLVNLIEHELKWKYDRENVNSKVIEENVIKNITEKSKRREKDGIISKMKSLLEDLF